jgi:hypothetical protein
MGRTVFISGSFIRHYDGMKKKIAEFESLDFTVLSPKSPIITSSISATILLRGADPTTRQIVQKMQEKLSAIETIYAIKSSDLFYLYNPGGTPDLKNSLELGMALGCRKPTFAEEAIDDKTLCEYCPPATMSQIMNVVYGGSSKLEAWLNVWSPKEGQLINEGLILKG